MPAPRRRVHVYVAGRVQGVWFRGSARDRANALGVDGFARNLRDGRVEIEAEGEAPTVEAFLAWCRVGPPGAQVDGLEVTEQAPIGGPRGFAIRRG